ncbi:hypothetical protein [Laspinema olomoucense]|uniref:hypothetical protein n=1 Tax=Laspinema olomoucense TaxID=3231600 RepID=UPI0021BBB5EC|nr:hypothetical protein [Laspinema sp. D3d]MCT7974898.1 hypothetical protein [Laspinema sp. D3d]
MTNEKQLISRALVMCLADPSGNPRPRRVIELLSNSGFHVSVFSFEIKGNLKVAQSFVIQKPSGSILLKLTRLCVRLFSQIIPSFYIQNSINEFLFNLKTPDELAREKFELIVVENLEMLPLAIRLKKKNKSKVLFDAREFYPKEFENNLFFKILYSLFRRKLCRHFLPGCDSIITVSPGLAKGYREMFNIQTQVIRSVPNYISMTVNEVISNPIKMVHHGATNRDRKLENMIKIFEYLDSHFSLDFYLTNNDLVYKSELVRLASQYSQIRFYEAVSFSKIIPTLNQYDIGLYLLEPTGFNTKYSLPNKFFEFIQARLMVAIGPSPDMAELVQEYQCGIISESFTPKSMARLLNKLKPEEIMNFKTQSDKAAQVLCFEEESKKLKKNINSLLEKPQLL